MPNVNNLLDEHVVLKYECLDRIFLNGYVARLQDATGLAWFLTKHRGEEIPRYALLGEMTVAFVKAVERMAEEKQIPVVHFEKGQRKEEVAAPYFAAAKREGVVMLGIAQEKANVFRAPAKSKREHGKYAASRGAAYVKYLYFYIWDNDWGPSFIKICTYAPWGIRVWLNGHQWLKRQLERQRIAYQPLDNGIASVDDPRAMQQTADRLTIAHIQRYFDRWMYRLPMPFTRADRKEGYVHQLSILQLEVSCTEVFDRPLHGRQFFEEVIRDQLDLGRPEKIQLLFHKRLPRRRGEGPFRTRVFSADVEPSLQIRHRDTGIKQYWKCGRALRTETTINNAHDFKIGKLLKNLDALRLVGRDINRRLLELERQSHHCAPAATTFENLILPTGDEQHRAPGLRFGDPRVVAVFGALADLRWVNTGFRSKDLRSLVEQHRAEPYGTRQMAYDLRRLQRKGLIVRLSKCHRYVLTALGRQLVMFCTKFYARVICRSIAQVHNSASRTPIAVAWRRFDREADTLVAALNLVA